MIDFMNANSLRNNSNILECLKNLTENNSIDQYADYLENFKLLKSIFQKHFEHENNILLSDKNKLNDFHRMEHDKLVSDINMFEELIPFSCNDRIRFVEMIEVWIKDHTSSLDVFL